MQAAISCKRTAHSGPGLHGAVRQGTYAKVKYGQHVETGEVVAIKV